MSEGGPGPATATGSGDWQVFTASSTGAYHVRAGARSEDAVATESLRHDGTGPRLVLAVADGHGHSRHFRSDRGAAIAVASAVDAVRAWMPARPPGSQVSGRDTSQLVADVVARWRRTVAADLAADPVGPGEAHAMHAGDPAEIPYGSTLLFGVLMPDAAVLAQIGDGDFIVVGPDGGDLAPVPGDSRLDGSQTTSLCQPDAIAAFRVAVVDLTRTPVYAIFAATDGYGNAQAHDRWQDVFAADLVRLAAERGPAWPGSQLDAWVALCASSEGSGDDSTAALALNTATVPRLPAEPTVTRPDSEPTELIRPTVPAADGWQPQFGQDVTLIDHGEAPPPPAYAQPAGPGQAPPARAGRAGLWLAGAIVVIVVVAAVLVLRSSSRSATGGGVSPTPSPSRVRTINPTPSPAVSPTSSRSAQEQAGHRHKHKHASPTALNSP
jgi:Protein phosphatase 2C